MMWRYFFNAACQFSTTVKGTAVCADGAGNRKRLPSGASSHDRENDVTALAGAVIILVGRAPKRASKETSKKRV